MADANRSELPRRAALGVVATWRRLNFEQRIAAIGALLLVVSTFGPFSFVEAAIVLIGVSVLFLLRRRAEGREFHIPFGDGTVIAAAGVWSAVLILIRLFDRPLGQNMLALVCAAILVVAGLAERRKRPADDLPGPDASEHQRDAETVAWEDTPARGRRRAARRVRRATSPPPDEAVTEPLPKRGESVQLELTPTPPGGDPLPPPEFHLPGEPEDEPTRERPRPPTDAT